MRVHADDPTRTTVLRADYTRAMTRRFALLRAAIGAAIADGFFGGGDEVLLELAAVELFTDWLQDEAAGTLLEIDAAGLPSGWQRLFVETAVLRGVAHADRLLAGAGYAARPVAVGGVSLFEATISRLAASNYDLLRNASADMISAIRQELVTGVGQRLPLDDIAARITGRVDAIGLNRARMIARTEIVRAHAEGTLDRFEDYGVGAVSALVEWDEGAHCPICTALQQADNGYGPGVYTLDQARGLIPVHPNCTCAWLPQPAPLVAAQNSRQPDLLPLIIAALRQRSRVLNWLLSEGG
jgi:hypothetical protein